MNSINKKIELFFKYYIKRFYCNFGLNGKFILYGMTKTSYPVNYVNNIWVYSTQTNSNKWKCQKIYVIPKEAELIKISKYDKIWLRLNECIHEWNIHTGNTTIISKKLQVIVYKWVNITSKFNKY